jgi:hypothetical protein
LGYFSNFEACAVFDLTKGDDLPIAVEDERPFLLAEHFEKW